MKPGAGQLRYMEMVRADIRDYRVLHERLEAQFEAALGHRVAQMREVGESIEALVDVLNERRAQRLALAAEITGKAPPGGHAAVLRQLSGQAATLLAGWTEELDVLVRECKRLNLRNCSLITEQHDLMRRVLQQEEQTYAPA